MLHRSREKRFVRTCIVLLVGGEVAFVILVYTIAGVQGTIQYPEIYISDTIKQDPGRAIGGYLIPLAAFLVVVIIGMRLNRIDPLLRRTRDVVLWYLACIALLGVFLGRMGVAAVPISTNRALHAVAAATLYISSVCMFTLLAILDECVGLDRYPNVRYTQISLCVLMWVFGLLFAITIDWVDQAAVVAQLVLALLFLKYNVTFYMATEFDMKSTYGPKEQPIEYFADTPPQPYTF